MIGKAPRRHLAAAEPAPEPEPLLVERAGADDLDAVMTIMTAAFPPDFGEAWTRSQCAGILPMAGVSLRLVRAAAPPRSA